MNIAEKIRAIRKAEGLTQVKFCEISGLALSTLKNYEGGHAEPGLGVVLEDHEHLTASKIHPMVDDR